MVLMKVDLFKYLGFVFCKHGKVEHKILEGSVQRRKLIGEVDSLLKG